MLHVCIFNCQFNSKLNCRPVRPTTHDGKTCGTQGTSARPTTHDHKTCGTQGTSARPTTHDHKTCGTQGTSTVILAEARIKAKMEQNKHGTACNPAVIHSDHHLLQQILHEDCEILCVLGHILLFSRHRLNFSVKKEKSKRKMFTSGADQGPATSSPRLQHDGLCSISMGCL